MDKFLRAGQRILIDLTVHQGRYRSQRHNETRYHIFRQFFTQTVTQRVGVIGASDIGHQKRNNRIFAVNYNRAGLNVRQA